MRVLMLNAFHWLKGGVERTLFDETRWLEAAGHEVAHFATSDARNVASPFAKHFAPAADFGEGTPAWRQLPQLSRAIWSAPAADALRGLLSEWRPDVAHVHAPSRYLTPSVIEVLARAGVPVVMSLHDFKPWCTNRVLFAHGAHCERCKGGQHWRAVATGCVQGSRLKSVVGAWEAYAHDRRGAYRPVHAFLAPSRAARDQAITMGADAARIRVLPHGVEAGRREVAPIETPARFVLFAGRLSGEKGVDQLPALAVAIAPVPLWVAGGGPRESWLRTNAGPTMRVLGALEPGELAVIRARADVVVVPSVFPETFGYAVAEAMLDARAVVAARIGAVPELIEHERTGLLVPPGDANALIEATQRALGSPEDAARWGEAARAHVQAEHAPERHLQALLEAYAEAMRAQAR